MILHIDMDAFYASVEERERPELMERPVVVGGTPEGRGVVAAANYAARKFGLHSAMAMSTALRLCPDVVVLPVRMSYYAEVSRQIRSIFFRYTPRRSHDRTTSPAPNGNIAAEVRDTSGPSLAHEP